MGFFKRETAAPVSATANLPKAVAFVDYEHWYISLKNNYGMQPNIKGWFEELNKSYNLSEVQFFADFSHKSLADEIGRIRLYSNKIIDTRSPTGVQKDFTDFILLDNIYQKALSSDDIGVFILFSGDAHFSSVTSFLKNFYHKEVVIYGINGSFSKRLQETATRSITLPDSNDINGGFYKSVFDYLKSSPNPSAEGALDAAVKKNRSAPKGAAQKALKQLFDAGVISERELPQKSATGKVKKQKSLFVDWDKAKTAGFLTNGE